MNSFVKLITYYISIFFIIQSVNAQSALVQQENLEKIGENWHNGSVLTFDNRYKGVNGTPFLFEDWLPGSITLISDTIITDLFLKYDVNEGRLYRKVNLNKANLILNYKIKSFKMIDIGYEKTYLKMALEDGEPETFVELLSKGKLNLLAKPECRLRKADKNSSYGTGRQYDEYIHSSELFIFNTNTQVLKPVKNSRKFFLEQMADKEDAIKKYLKRNKPFLKEASAVIKLVNYYNGL